MELTQLAQFKAIAECETMTEAADKIHISQPALSATLKKLEDELDIRLFERKRNRITLNDAGKLALSHVNAVLEQVAQMKAELHQYTRKDNTFSIAFCDPGPLWYCVPRFSITHPDFEIISSRFEEVGNEKNILLGQVHDIIFSSKKLEASDITSFLFIQDRLLLSVPIFHPLSKQTEMHLRKTKGLSIAYYNGGGSFTKKQQPFWEALGTKVHRTLYEDRELYTQIIRGTDVLTISTKLVQHYRDDGNGRILIPLTDPELEIDYYICYLSKNKKRLSPFLTWAERCAEDFSG